MRAPNLLSHGPPLLALTALLLVACGPSSTGSSSDPAPSPSAEETLCWNTGGAWSNGACECAQDGATLAHVFDSQLGCKAPDAPVADPEDLCWNTGGAWLNGVCECAQDGATIYHVFDTEVGCKAPNMQELENLCWNTGGAWFNGACECAQDGATLDHVFDVHIGCRAPTT